MKTFGRFVLRSVVSASLAFALPVVALAGGGANPPASPQPRPVREVKVWTNDDFAALGPRSESTSEPAPASAARPTAAVAAPASAAPLPSGEDPQWYAEQLTGLEDELASVAAREQQLRQFRATGTGLPTGLNVVAPCQGVGTDNLIAQLAARRQEIEQQIDALGDTARSNGMPPGILVQGRGRVSIEKPLTPEQQQESLIDRYRSLSDDLAQAQATIASMHADTASRRMTLLQPDSRWGGNMTTNLLQGLYGRESALQSELSAIEDEARSSGLAAEQLR